MNDAPTLVRNILLSMIILIEFIVEEAKIFAPLGCRNFLE